MPETDRYEIVIAGAGPAGLSTALHLAHIAPDLVPRALVLEKQRHPRPKLCGGALVVDAEVILRRLGLDVREIPHVDVRAAHFDFAGRGLIIRLWRGYTLRLVRRDEFDAWLAGKAREKGIEIREGVTVLSVKPGAEGVTVETTAGTYHARGVVGADGSNGVVRGCILPQASACTARTLEVVVQPNGNGRHHPREAYFDFHPIPSGIAGYTWDFPGQAGGKPVRVWGIYDANLFRDEKRPPLREVLRAEMARHGCRLEEGELQGHPIRWFDPFNRIAVPHVLLAGDAAGADPIFGEGISMALGYGKIAARALRAACSRQDFTFRDYRWRVLRSSLGQALIVRWLIAHVLFSLRWRWLQALFWWVLKPVVAIVGLLFVVNWARRSR